VIDCCDKRLPTLSLDRLNENREVLIDLERSVSHADANVRVHVDGFLAPYGYVLLEALRARRALRVASLTLHETTQGSYAQPFSRIVGFDGPALGARRRSRSGRSAPTPPRPSGRISTTSGPVGLACSAA